MNKGKHPEVSVSRLMKTKRSRELLGKFIVLGITSAQILVLAIGIMVSISLTVQNADATIWNPEQEIGEDSGVEFRFRPSIAVENDMLHVVWQDQGEGDWDIFYRKGDEQPQDLVSPNSRAEPIIPYRQGFMNFDVSWTASDDTDLANITLYYRYSHDNFSWGSWRMWAYDYNISGLSASGTFSFTAWGWDGFYEFYTIANDSSGNEEAAPLMADAFVEVDMRPLPPSNFGLSLTGNNFEDLTLTWDLSPDDGAGLNNVMRYDIYRGTDYRRGASMYLQHAMMPPGTTSYTDVLAGNGDSNNYFYLICSINDLDFFFCPGMEQVGKFTRGLSVGPNLVSFPLVQDNDEPSMVLQTLTYDNAWYYDSINQEWRSLSNAKPYPGDLTTLDRSMGFWINVTQYSHLSVVGKVPLETTIYLREGWNLVGFPSFDRTFEVAYMKTWLNVVRVETYYPTGAYHLEALRDIDFLTTGYGYWVLVDSDTTWVVNID